MKRRGLRMAPEKVRKRGLYCLSPVRIAVFNFLLVFCVI